MKKNNISVRNSISKINFLLKKSNADSKAEALSKKCRKSIVAVNKGGDFSKKCNKVQEGYSSICMVNKIPADVIKEIFKHFSYLEIVKNISVVCKLFRDAANNEVLWQHIYQQSYPFASRKAGDPWKQLFICRKIEEKRQQYSKLPHEVAEQFIYMDSAFQILKEQKKLYETEHPNFFVSSFSSSATAFISSPFTTNHAWATTNSGTLSPIIDDKSQHNCQSSRNFIDADKKIENKSDCCSHDVVASNFLSAPSCCASSSFSSVADSSSTKTIAIQENCESNAKSEEIKKNLEKLQQKQKKSDILSVGNSLIKSLLVCDDDDTDKDSRNKKKINANDYTYLLPSQLIYAQNMSFDSPHHHGYQNDLSPVPCVAYTSVLSSTYTPPYSPFSCSSYSPSTEDTSYPSMCIHGCSNMQTRPPDIIFGAFSSSIESTSVCNGKAVEVEEEKQLKGAAAENQSFSNVELSNILSDKNNSPDSLLASSSISSTPSHLDCLHTSTAATALCSAGSPSRLSSSIAHGTYENNDIICCTLPNPLITVEMCLADWRIKNAHIASVSSSLNISNSSHICSGQQCSFTVISSLDLYICNQTGKYHICGGLSSCERAFPSDQDLGYLVCPVTGRMFDCLSSVCTKGKLFVRNGVSSQQKNNECSIATTFESETQQYMNTFMAEKQQEEKDREDENDIEETELTWGLPGFFGQCWAAGYNAATENFSRKKKRKK